MERSASRAMGALQQLSAIGLPNRQAFPEFIGLLSEIAPFETAAMLWLGPDCQPVDTYSSVDAAPELTTRYATRWFNCEEADYHPSQMAMQTDPRFSVIRVSDFTAAFGETEYYDEVYSGVGHHWIAALALRDSDGPIGNVGIGRPANAPDFSDEEIRLLRMARPYVIQAISRAADLEDWPDNDLEDDAAMLLIDAKGHIVHASPNAWRLLHGAAGLPASLSLMRDTVYAWARPLVLRLAGLVAESLRGVAAGPARIETVTPYGRFLLRAYAMDSNLGPGSGAIGVQIERRLPVGVKMFRSRSFRALTEREQAVARLLSTGLSYPQIADKLGMGASTVVTHVRSLGFKLGVGGREDIVSALVA